MARRLDADALAVDLERDSVAGMGRGGGHDQRGEDIEFFHVGLLVDVWAVVELARTLVEAGGALCDRRHDATAALSCLVTGDSNHIQLSGSEPGLRHTRGGSDETMVVCRSADAAQSAGSCRQRNLVLGWRTSHPHRRVQLLPLDLL